jgi:hypothetical protein
MAHVAGPETAGVKAALAASYALPDMTTNQNNSWTPEVEQQLRAMLLKGKSVHAISARLKRTMGAVRSRAHLLGLSVTVDRAVRDRRNAAKRAANSPA